MIKKQTNKYYYYAKRLGKTPKVVSCVKTINKFSNNKYNLSLSNLVYEHYRISKINNLPITIWCINAVAFPRGRICHYAIWCMNTAAVMSRISFKETTRPCFWLTLVKANIFYLSHIFYCLFTSFVIFANSIFSLWLLLNLH